MRIAPTTEIAEMALVSDISGVCSSGDTLRMISRPTNVASMKTYRPSSRLEGIDCSHQLADARMDDFAGVRHQRLADDFVFEVERELSVLDEVFEECRDVLRIHLAGVVGDGGWQVH